MQKAAAGYAKKKVLGEAATRYHAKRPAYETDPELIAATQEAAAKQPKHWWKREKKFTPEMLLSKEDRKILHKVKSRAWTLDKGLSCCGFQIGLDGIVGLIPGIGDVIGSAFSLQLIKTASKANLPKELIFKMLLNVVIDFMVGLTPIAGDLLDIFFKANWRNAMLLEEYLLMRRRDELRLEKGEAAGAALLDDALQEHRAENSKTGNTSSSTGNTLPPSSSSSSKPVAAHHVNNTVSPIITEVDDDGNEITHAPDGSTTTTKKKKYGTFFGKWRSGGTTKDTPTTTTTVTGTADPPPPRT